MHWFFADATDEDDKKRGSQEETSSFYGNGHSSLFVAVKDAINKNCKLYVGAIVGHNALELILAINKSQLTGKLVNLPLKNFASVNLKGIFWEGRL